METESVWLATLAPLRPHKLRCDVTPHRSMGLPEVGQMGLLGPLRLLGLLGVPRYMLSRAVLSVLSVLFVVFVLFSADFGSGGSAAGEKFLFDTLVGALVETESVWLNIPKTLARLSIAGFTSAARFADLALSSLSVWLAPPLTALASPQAAVPPSKKSLFDTLVGA